MSEFQFPDVRVSDQVIIYNDESKSDYVTGWVMAVGSRTIDALCFSERGMEWRRDVVHETDPRIPVLQQQEYFADSTRGIFRVADSTAERRGMATRLNALDSVLESLVRRVTSLERAVPPQDASRYANKPR